MSKQTLLSKAKLVPVKRGGKGPVSAEEAEFVYGYFTGAITNGQAAEVLGVTQAAVYVWMTTRLKRLLASGQFQISA